MSTNINIEDGGSMILSYNFIYNESIFKEMKINENRLPKIENLLSYTDRLFTNNKIIKYDKQLIFLYVKGSLYKLKIDDMNILFFENKIAILYIKLSSKDFSDIQKLYKINKALTNFYTKKNDSYVYIGKNDPLLIKLPIEKFKTQIKNIDREYSDTIIKALENKIPENKIVFDDEYIQIKSIQNEKEIIVHACIKKYNKFTETFSLENYSLYNPHNKDKRDYPFSDEHKEFKGRVGFSKDEQEKIIKQNKEFDLDNTYNRHYMYFEQQKKLVNNKKEKEHIFNFIHYDTFITSLILEYIDTNESFQYYDTFNPRATSYINNYISLTCNSNVINKEYEKNFISFEPLISSKTIKGGKITNPDFFNIYQSQADIFTIGNSHNIVHIIDKNASNGVQNNKEKDHFFVYLLTCMQRSFILNIINSSIVNINNLEHGKLNLKEIRKTYSKLSKALNNYNNYLTNVNFHVISNSSSVDSSYSFFRKCNEIDKLTSQWNIVSKKFHDWKSILSHVLSKHPVISFLTIITFGLIIKLINNGLNALWAYLVKTENSIPDQILTILYHQF